jgi:hypothetical protein
MNPTYPDLSGKVAVVTGGSAGDDSAAPTRAARDARGCGVDHTLFGLRQFCLGDRYHTRCGRGQNHGVIIY